ncbi:hypothetical protein QG37_08344 [Candidozyma auris]|nr:hypothetical protein QG37_08344 [[Candida] auris]
MGVAQHTKQAKWSQKFFKVPWKQIEKTLSFQG